MAVGLTLATTSGCGAVDVAVTGISVTTDGRLLGVIMVCERRIDGTGLRAETSDPEGSTRVGEWTPDRPLKAGLTMWSLDSPTSDWTTARDPGPLEDGTVYTLSGWGEEHRSSAEGIDFTTADRERLTPGKVLYEQYTEDGEESVRFAPLSEFESTACDGI
ncbi:hypothetical protein [Streptomyces sp. NBC_00102]|uniref:hypothetical protein n=1 Tax=Streptomyces sp. NBC_00102 TaxID=2975652 RepID=UPI002255B8E7|nr:hypothetical protein [Streptomyces sp. NBC_00102]MCX5396859.1 hypothetical protein [Streptomyces sp. NBC_00102]